jgi:hypothetical protein
MRQVRDTLVWLAMILVVLAVIQFTPRLANYVSAMNAERAQIREMSHDVAYYPDDTFIESP